MEQIGKAADRVVNRWAYWQAALKGIFGGVHMDSPEQGYWRMRKTERDANGNKKTVGYLPVAIWFDDMKGDWIAHVDGKEADPYKIWTYVCRAPITVAVYDAVRAGKPWPDMPDSIGGKVDYKTPQEKAASIGDNSGEISELEALNDQIESALRDVDNYKKIESDEQLARAQALRSRLNELSNEADKKRAEIKKPHWDAAQAVDKQWQPLVKGAKAGADTVRSAMSAYETELLRKRREEDARIAAEEAKKQAEEAKRASDGAEIPSEPDVAPAPSPEPSRATIKGGYGKAASVRVKTTLKEVTDWQKAAVYFSNDPELRAVIEKLAKLEIEAGRSVPGASSHEVADVR